MIIRVPVPGAIIAEEIWKQHGIRLGWDYGFAGAENLPASIVVDLESVTDPKTVATKRAS